jgi:hypothetical protein
MRTRSNRAGRRVAPFAAFHAHGLTARGGAVIALAGVLALPIFIGCESAGIAEAEVFVGQMKKG